MYNRDQKHRLAVIDSIDPINGSQTCFTGIPDHNKIIILAGYNKASNVKVGDIGTLTYKVSRNSGLWWFEKIESQEELATAKEQAWYNLNEMSRIVGLDDPKRTEKLAPYVKLARAVSSKYNEFLRV